MRDAEEQILEELREAPSRPTPRRRRTRRASSGTTLCSEEQDEGLGKSKK